VAVGLAAAAIAGCSVNNLAFREDDRIDIVSPGDREEVRLPVRIRWTSELDPPASGGPYYAVFLDREPIRPGQSLRSLGDDSCDKTPGCPDLQYLRDRYVFVTDERSLTLDAVPAKDSSQRTGADRHEATIVLIDRDGRRIGESSYTVEFAVEEDN
jgi:hypothetical protein